VRVKERKKYGYIVEIFCCENESRSIFEEMCLEFLVKYMSSQHCRDVTAEGKVEISTMCKTMNILFFLQGNNATFS